MTFLCDTNILSELVRRQPNSGVVAWAEQVPVILVSVVTVEEIAYGLAWKPNPRARSLLGSFLRSYSEVLPVTPEIAERSGWLRGTLQARGEARSQADMLIAATAQVHGFILVTRNAADFKSCDLPILNPFR